MHLFLFIWWVSENLLKKLTLRISYLHEGINEELGEPVHTFQEIPPKRLTSAPIEAWRCNFPPFQVIPTYR